MGLLLDARAAVHSQGILQMYFDPHWEQSQMSAPTSSETVSTGRWSSYYGEAYQEPLHLAAQAGHARVAQLMLERRTTASDRNGAGHTPLEICSGRGPAFTDIAGLLE